MTRKELEEYDKRERERDRAMQKKRMGDRFYDDDPEEEDHINDCLYKRGREKS